MAAITFHSMEGSSYLWTAMLIADEKGVAYDFHAVELHSPEHLRLHPFGKMPVLQHGDFVVYESLAIAHYIDAAFPGPALAPADPRGRAEMLRWISIVNAYVFPVMNRYFKECIVKPQWGIAPDAAFIESALAQLPLQVRLIDEAVAKDGYLVGDRLTLADGFLFPILLFFGLTDEGAALLCDARSAAAWLERMKARPSYPGRPIQTTYEALATHVRSLKAAQPLA
jgi:glutathione S-transferase